MTTNEMKTTTPGAQNEKTWEDLRAEARRSESECERELGNMMISTTMMMRDGTYKCVTSVRGRCVM